MFDTLACVARKVQSANGNGQRSGCPVSVSLERFGDRWSLLLIRDMMVRGYKTFKEFQNSGEGISSNILAHRLERLCAAGIVSAERNHQDSRRVIYRLTEKGIDLAPVMLELLVWAARWEETAAPCEVMRHMEANRGAVIDEVRRRWRERDPAPFLPPFAEPLKRISIGKKRPKKGVAK
jgi:DNA-binding HxlR family transcriptional regulator